MIDLNDLRNIEIKTLSLGSHPGVIQAMMDYDFLAGKQQPSVIGIVARGRKQERFFWGESEVIVPIYEQIADIPPGTLETITAAVNVQSARRVLSTTREAIRELPNLKVITTLAPPPERSKKTDPSGLSTLRLNYAGDFSSSLATTSSDEVFFVANGYL